MGSLMTAAVPEGSAKPHLYCTVSAVYRKIAHVSAAKSGSRLITRMRMSDGEGRTAPLSSSSVFLTLALQGPDASPRLFAGCIWALALPSRRITPKSSPAMGDASV